MRRVIVVGGGPAGMMAAIAAAENGASVTLLEKNEKLGKKLYLTGKGRCNVTNVAEGDEFLSHIPHNARFLRSSFSAFSNRDLMEMIALSTPLKIERGGRVFPQSDKASDITRALQSRMDASGVQVRLNCEVLHIALGAEGIVKGVETSEGFLPGGAVVVATGGVSYPSTGSTGDGYRFAAETGLEVVPPAPSLIPLETDETWPSTLQGLTLKNVALSAVSTKGKRLYHNQGEMLFTHFGISGPLVLEMSAYLNEKEIRDVELALDMKPALTLEQVQARLLCDFETNQRKQLLAVLEGLLPRRMAPEFAHLLQLDETMPVHQVSKTQRAVIAQLLKQIPMHIRAMRPIAEAIITRGGVQVSAIHPRTMEAKARRGLYFAGEVLDVDGCTGGFNLQIAFSTGHAAGVAAASQAQERGMLS